MEDQVLKYHIIDINNELNMFDVAYYELPKVISIEIKDKISNDNNMMQFTLMIS